MGELGGFEKEVGFAKANLSLSSGAKYSRRRRRGGADSVVEWIRAVEGRRRRRRWKLVRQFASQDYVKRQISAD